MASSAGLTVHSYRDLEGFEEQFLIALPIGSLKRISDFLNIRLADLFSTKCYDQPITFDSLANLVRKSISAKYGNLAALEDVVGWRLEPFLADPRSAMDEPIEFIQEVSKAVGVSWSCVLDAL